MFTIFLCAVLILLIISILLMIFIKKRKQATHFYSIQAFLGSHSYTVLDNHLKEQKKSLIDTINDFFNDSNDKITDDEHTDLGDDGDDAGE